jgi:hypothetical protein
MRSPRPGPYLSLIDSVSARSEIDRILITPGNHEAWSALNYTFTT